MRLSPGVKAVSMETRKLLEAPIPTFVILKMTGLVDWSWWFVLSPFWIGIALVPIYLVAHHIFGEEG